MQLAFVCKKNGTFCIIGNHSDQICIFLSWTLKVQYDHNMYKIYGACGKFDFWFAWWHILHNLGKATAFMSRVETDFRFFCSFVPTVIFLSLLALIPRFATTFAAKKDKAVPSSRRRPVMIGWTLINYLAPTPLPTTGSCLALREMAKKYVNNIGRHFFKIKLTNFLLCFFGPWKLDVGQVGEEFEG